MRPVRMVARDRPYTDTSGHEWAPDRCAYGGRLVVRNEPIANTKDADLYHGERFGNIRYSIPVAQPGRYALMLYFSETWFGPDRPGGGGEGSRIFDILCNGVALRRHVDLFKEAGGSNRALALTFHNLEPNPQGKLVILLEPRQNYACINALEIVDESP
ncbi:MAG: malectin domain-containing carbohydrate-binding protein, partial [Bryobacteraceae bacterium]